MRRRRKETEVARRIKGGNEKEGDILPISLNKVGFDPWIGKIQEEGMATRTSYPFSRGSSQPRD